MICLNYKFTYRETILQWWSLFFFNLSRIVWVGIEKENQFELFINYVSIYYNIPILTKECTSRTNAKSMKALKNRGPYKNYEKSKFTRLHLFVFVNKNVNEWNK